MNNEKGKKHGVVFLTIPNNYRDITPDIYIFVIDNYVDELKVEVAMQTGAKVHTGVLLSGYINDTHTYVPGPGGKFGYGGKCFPKDVNAFAKMTEGTPLGTLLEHMHELNVHFRGVEEHI